jgi:hypothetical protein
MEPRGRRESPFRESRRISARGETIMVAELFGVIGKAACNNNQINGGFAQGWNT